jgi:hypothetical protein
VLFVTSGAAAQTPPVETRTHRVLGCAQPRRKARNPVLESALLVELRENRRSFAKTLAQRQHAISSLFGEEAKTFGLGGRVNLPSGRTRHEDARERRCEDRSTRSDGRA